jgi:nitroreductase
MEVQDAIRGRRSIRGYTKEQVSGEDIQTILEAGSWAPSGLNNQPWRFKVLKGELKDRIASHTKYGMIIKAAPVCIAVFLDKDESYNRVKDLQAVGACIQNMLLTIHDLGLGGVWLGEILNQREKVERELNTKHELMAAIALGHPAENGKSSRKKLGELVLP